MFLVSQTEGSEVFTLSLGYCTTFLHKRELRRSGSSGSWGSDETAIVPGPRPEIFHQPFSLFVKRLIIQITFNLISVNLFHCGHIRWGERWRGEAVPCRFQYERNIYQHGQLLLTPINVNKAAPNGSLFPPPVCVHLSPPPPPNSQILFCERDLEAK